MKASSLRQIFLQVLAVQPVVALMLGCGGDTSSASNCGSVPPGHVNVPLAAIDQSATDSGVIGDADGGIVSHHVGDQVSPTACYKLCPDSGITSGFCSIDSIHGSTAVLSCHADCTGRRPAGFDPCALPGALAEMARLEAASVYAFRRLRKELAGYGAPRHLLRACTRAARDEIRHTRVMTTLAKRRGERVSAPRIAPASARSLEAIAVENAVEGCVRETYGALMATGDAQSHPDPEIRRAMQRIAPDETRHAALAWTIAQWLDTKLNDGARARVRAARDAEARRIVSRACDGSAKVLASLLWNVAS